ncbi:MAG: glycine cleavage system protein GcvH [Eubacteriales bacterium]|nr:glycine cleavage system protein GcvH [Eubacteriales bacterium]
MNFPKELYYTKTHEWVRDLKDGRLEIGLTDYAQNELGDLVFVNLPQAGDAMEREQPFADVESVKAVSDVYSPVDAVVCEINEELLDAPQKINEDPYGAWLVRVEKTTEHVELMDSEAYEKATQEA